MKDLRDDLKIARTRAHSPEIVAAVDRAEALLQAWAEAAARCEGEGAAPPRVRSAEERDATDRGERHEAGAGPGERRAPIPC